MSRSFAPPPLNRRDRGSGQRRSLIAAVVAAALLGSLLSLLQPAAAAAAAEDSCPGYVILGSRGSGQDFDDANLGLGNQVGDFARHLRAKMPDISLDTWANPYPAVSPHGAAAGLIAEWLEMLLHGQQTAIIRLRSYHASMTEGVSLLQREVESVIAGPCSDATELILAGYSQGAQVAANVYHDLSVQDRQHVFAMALWGDPRFNPASEAARGDFDPKRGGLLNFRYTRRPEFHDPEKVISYCHQADPVCQGLIGPISFSQHTNYHTSGDAAAPFLTYTERAATRIAAMANHPGAPDVPVAKITPPDPADLVPNEVFAISAAQSLDADGVPDTYAWNLGQGFMSSGTRPFWYTELPEGEHTVTLRVTANSGETATDTITLTIAPPAPYGGPPQPPIGVESHPSADGSSATLTWAPSKTGPPAEGYTVSTSDGFPLYVSRSADERSLTLPAGDLPMDVVVTAYNRRGDSAPTTPVVMRSTDWSAASDLNELWRAYGDAGNHWTGGDRTVSIPLPDGRVAWLFSDTFLGTVNVDRSRPVDSPMVSNTIVVQNSDGRLGSTLHGGTAVSPEALVSAKGSEETYWVGDGLADDHELKVLYNTYTRTGDGALDMRLTGTSLATISLPDLTLESVRALPAGDRIAWGSAVLDDDDYTYVYGSSDPDGDGARWAHVARVSRGALGGPWQYWTGSAWSNSPSDAARLFRGVGTAFSVAEVGGQYVLITQDSNIVFSPAIVAYTAQSPTGPFRDPTVLFEAPQEYPDKPVIVYDPHVHDSFGADGNLVLSYNVNSLDPSDNFTDAHIYRPRFVKVPWPPTRPEPGTLPQAPTGLTATNGDHAMVHLRWDPVAGADIKYRVYQRDVTSGQDMFSRYPGAGTTAAAADLPWLKNGHAYEFRITAQNTAGEGPPSEVASLLVQSAPPLAPTNLRAEAMANGDVLLDWEPTSDNVLYTVYKRDLSAEETDFTTTSDPEPSDTTHTVRNLIASHDYEFRVTARNGAGESPPSNTAQATVLYEKPSAPTGLSAASNTDGTIDLAWTAPSGGPVWYWIYQRDITDDPDAEFTAWTYPSTGATTARAQYLQHGHRYEFRVTATNQGGDGPPSNVASAMSKYAPPGKPDDLKAVSRDGEVELSWTAPQPDVWYWVYYRNVTENPAAEFTRSAYPVTEAPSMTMGWLANGDVYEFKVTATNQGGEGPSSSIVSARPLPAKPGPVTALTATPNTNGRVTLTWTNPGGNNYYWVYSRNVTTNEPFTKWAYPATGTSATTDPLKHNDVYEFKVAATNVAGDGPDSAAIRATARYALPTAPTNLKGASAGDGSVRLTWEPPSPDCCYYFIHWRDVTAGQTSFQTSAYPTDKPTATIGSLRHGDVYEFKVSATNQAGQGPATTPIRVTSYGGLPLPPTNLIATPGDGKVTLSWRASPTGNVDYWVYSRDATTGQGWVRTQYWTPNLSFISTYLHNGHTYEYFVTATNASGESASSNVMSARPMPPIPVAPSNLTATPGDGKVTLNWPGNTPGVYYWVEMRDATAGEAWRRLPDPTPYTTFTANTLWNSHTYDFRVRATNIAGDSAPSNTATARPMPPVPAPPPNLRLNMEGNGVLRFSWDSSPTRNVYYWIEMRDATAGEAWRRLPAPTPNTWLDAKWLTNGHYYEIRVRATNVAGDSAPSNVIRGRPMPPEPSPPSGLGGTSGTTWIELTWNASSTPNIWNYRVYGRDASRGQAFSLWSNVRGCCSTMFRGLWPGHAYEFYIVAVDYLGQTSLRTDESTRRTASVPLAVEEPTFLGTDLHLSREGTRVFIDFANRYSDGTGACADAVGLLGLPGRIVSSACDVTSAVYGSLADSAYYHYSRGACVTWHMKAYVFSWVTKDDLRTSNCY